MIIVGEKYKSKDGRDISIVLKIETLKEEYPFLGIITDEKGKQVSGSWDKNGKVRQGGKERSSGRDLIV